MEIEASNSLNHDTYIFICGNRRTVGTCCGSDERDQFFEQMKQLIKQYKPHLKCKVKLNKSGCLGHCVHGPNLVIFPDNIWYRFSSYDDLKEIMVEHILQGIPVKRLIQNFQLPPFEA